MCFCQKCTGGHLRLIGKSTFAETVHWDSLRKINTCSGEVLRFGFNRRGRKIKCHISSPPPQSDGKLLFTENKHYEKIASKALNLVFDYVLGANLQNVYTDRTLML